MVVFHAWFLVWAVIVKNPIRTGFRVHGTSVNSVKDRSIYLSIYQWIYIYIYIPTYLSVLYLLTHQSAFEFIDLCLALYDSLTLYGLCNFQYHVILHGDLIRRGKDYIRELMQILDLLG